MSKLVWDAIGERFYETGIDHGVLYPVESGAYPKGYAWNGLTFCRGAWCYHQRLHIS